MAAAYLLVLLILALGILPLFVSGRQPSGTGPETPPAAGENGGGGADTTATTATTPAPGPPLHFVSSAPAAGSTLTSRPADVSITFDAELAASVSIAISSGGKDYGSGDTTVDENGMTLRRLLDPVAPGGPYTVSYHACWTDGNCGDGSFQFILNQSG